MGEQDAPLRVYIAGLIHETNSFSPMPTSLHSFEADVCYRPALGRGRAAALSAPGYGDLLAAVGEGGDLVVEGPCFLTQPSAPVGLAIYHCLRDEIIAGLEAAGAVDMVLLALHGAMMAQGLEDCEADLVQQVRAVVGAQVPIGVLLDLHGNVSPELVGSGAIIIAVKYYPHTDYRPRAAELHAITAAMARGRSRPTISYRSIPCFNLLGTSDGPLRDLVADVQRIEAEEGILSISLMHGFPWADWEGAGGAVLVISEGRDLAAVDALIETLAARYEAAVTAGSGRRLGVDAAIAEALAHLEAPTAGAAPSVAGLVVIADSADNPGGGASCDSTFLLRALLAADVRNAALGMIWDPQAARIAADAGEGGAAKAARWR